MSEMDEYAGYLSHPKMARFSGEVFGSIDRLPVLGAILLLAPEPEVGYFHVSQLISLVGGDKKNVYVEVRKAENERLVENQWPAYVRPKAFTRLDSPRWEIVRVALAAARIEIDG